MLLLAVKKMLVWVVEELDREIVAGFLRFLENSAKTFHTISHSCSMLAMSFWQAWKEKVIEVVEVLTDERVGRK